MLRGSVNTPELKHRVTCFRVVTFAEEEPVSMSFAWGPMGPKVRTNDLAPFSFFSDDVAHAPTQTHAGAPVFLPSCLCLKHLLPATGPHPTHRTLRCPPSLHPSHTQNLLTLVTHSPGEFWAWLTVQTTSHLCVYLVLYLAQGCSARRGPVNAGLHE